MSQIDNLYKIFADNSEVLKKFDFEDLQQLQSANTKFFIIACASFFEDQMKSFINDFAKKACSENTFIINFIKKELIDRGYHKILDWKENPNYTKFLKYFSISKENCKSLLDDKKIDILDFELYFNSYVQMTNQRNNLIHNNIVMYDITQTINDAYNQFNQANYFVELIPSLLQTTIKKVNLSDFA